MRTVLDLVAAAQRAAERAAGYLRVATPPAPETWGVKDRNDFVTEVDRRAEGLIAETLAALVPGSRVIGEELTPRTAAAADVVWIVDPLDGTTNFLHGYPQYAVSIGCVLEGRLVAGVVLDVPRNRLYRAASGQGAWLGDTRLAVSSIGDPRQALVGTGFPYRRFEQLDRYLAQLAAVLREASGVRRAGSASLDLADVAAGRFDGFWELLLAPWDKAAGTVLVREAGGVVTTLEGEDDVLGHGSIVAGNPAIHRWLMDLLRGS
ncbi:MAG TPA: inositol monophosphatase family protein [Gemmatimonadales bacterium]|nr:inositol monophosphatase family protein [Gemmatimonadales bacterium]